MRIDQSIMEIISQAKIEGELLVLQGQLDRQTYTKVNKVLELAGAKWDRKRKGHVFADGTSERVDEMLLTGEIEHHNGNTLDFFATPMAVTKIVLDHAQPRKGQTVLEPSAGEGHLAKEFYHAGCEVDCIELHAHRADGLARSPETWRRLVEDDFLDINQLDWGNTYDLVVMNPPFSKGREVSHVLHAWDFVKAGGRLLSIMSAGVTFRSDSRYKAFRQWVEQNQGRIIPLDPQAFKTSGTMVNTVLVVVDKPAVLSPS